VLSERPTTIFQQILIRVMIGSCEQAGHAQVVRLGAARRCESVAALCKVHMFWSSLVFCR